MSNAPLAARAVMDEMFTEGQGKRVAPGDFTRLCLDTLFAAIAHAHFYIQYHEVG